MVIIYKWTICLISWVIFIYAINSFYVLPVINCCNLNLRGFVWKITKSTPNFFICEVNTEVFQ